MTNEIKEILEALKSHNDIVKEYPLTLSIEEQKILLDYITDLQEENERLKTTQIFIDTQDPEERCGQALYEEMLKRDCENYKQRIDKAVEYIDSDEFWFSQRIAEEELLNILRGDE